MTSTERALRIAAKKGVVRTRDLLARGVPRVALTRLERAGRLVRVSRGLYRLPDHDATEQHTTAAAVTRIPSGIVCLLSALRFHDLTTQQPAEIWIAVDRKARKPTMDDLPVRIVRFSGEGLRIGVQETKIEGVTARITTPARTVVDCFRYRNKIGLDVALEALRDFRRKHRRKLGELWSIARELRALGVLRPYLEAVA